MLYFMVAVENIIHNFKIVMLYISDQCVGILYSFVLRSPWRWRFKCWNV